MKIDSVEKELLWIADILDKCKIKFWLSGGIVLGIIREGHRLMHDHDIDIAVWEDDMKDKVEMLKAYIPELRYVPLEKRMVIRKKEYKNFKIDIFYHFREGKYVCMEMGGLRPIKHCYPERLYKEFEQVKYIGREFNVISPVRDYLRLEYGDWKKVRKVWDTTKDSPSIRVWDNKKL